MVLSCHYLCISIIQNTQKAGVLDILSQYLKAAMRCKQKNFRGITLNNILAKIYSQILLNRLTEWTEEYRKISNCQFGYQKGKSTTDCIFILNSVVSKVLNSGQQLYAVFIDYEKCFDKIDHIFIRQKLILD